MALALAILSCSSNFFLLVQGSEILEGDETSHHGEPVDALLFPFFALGLGVIAYCLLTRFLPFIPYTAVMFLLGTCIGLGTTRLDHNKDDSLVNISVTNFWLEINSELLLVSFLPALIYHDALNLDVHLFQKAFWQCVIMAFPLVSSQSTE